MTQETTRTVALILLIGGAVLALLSLAADFLGLGDPSQIFGPIQIGGTVVGIVVAAVGGYLYTRKAA